MIFVYDLLQSAKTTPPLTTLTAPVELFMAKSVVLPVIVNVTVLPSPPVTDAVETSVPPGAVHS
jgi:hypothetical protein